ncbi:hypothetical protein HanXRQr2_Chr14g0621221 [Helianthus annuus]|uniref:Uncharacterized protein n=1 Tax=Helianthus annuus TaxID=4232 RepID=A0A9K3E6P2_HELAN|nr:hypothetical protein HanXRQr2_Chr14g0621221 [Helianthus annuus]KAJ0838564.1 hypothetical protein HanPSC8_Chr14g0596361 [Helianthus annuus]
MCLPWRKLADLRFRPMAFAKPLCLKYEVEDAVHRSRRRSTVHLHLSLSLGVKQT